MKKLFFLLLTCLFLLSCSKDNEEAEVTPTTYQVINNVSYFESEYDLDGTLYEVTVFKFIEDDLAGEDNLGTIPPEGGTSEIMELDDRVTKIKVSFKFLPRGSQYYDLVDRTYTASYTFINHEEHNEVELNDDTMMQGTLKAKEQSIKSYLSKIKLNGNKD